MVGAFLLGNNLLGGNMQLYVKVFDWFPAIPANLWEQLPESIQAWALKRNLRQRREAKWKKLHALNPYTLQEYLRYSLEMVVTYQQLTREEREVLTKEDFETLREWVMHPIEQSPTLSTPKEK
jgi:hypothetical protein